MLSANDKENVYVLATEVQKDDGPFHCPACEEEVILKAGRVKIAHFAHLPNSNCSYAGEPESEEHLTVPIEATMTISLSSRPAVGPPL